MKKILDAFSFFVLLLAFVIMIYYAYMSFFPFEIIRYTNQDQEGVGIYQILTPTVKRGESIRYISDFEKLMDIGGEMSCYFQDGLIHQLPDRSSNNPVGYHYEVRSIEVPLSLNTGEYIYTCTVRYKLTMGRVIDYTFKTEPFIVE